MSNCIHFWAKSCATFLLVAAFADSAYSQTACSSPTALSQVFVRNEGVTELLGDYTFSCSGPGGTATIRVFLTPALPVTSAVLSPTSGTTIYTEALAIVGGVNQVQGVVDPAGTSITFSGVAIPAAPAPAKTSITITNIRVNVTSVAIGSGFPPAISESVFVSGINVNPALLAAMPVGYVATGLGTQSVSDVLSGAANVFGAPGTGVPGNLISCSTLTPALPSFFVRFKESSNTAFKQQGSAVTNATPGSPAGLNTETAYVPAAWPNTPGATNIATGATRIKIVLSNVPQNVVAYFPISPVTDAAGFGSLALIGSETGAIAPFGATVPDSKNLLPTGANAPALALVGSSGNTITAIYEVISQNAGGIDAYSIPVYFSWLANTVTGSTTPVSVSVSFAPTGSPATIPNFSIGKSTTPLNGPTVASCFSTLLFPFVTNEAGFDTSLVIANTSTDPFGAAGAVGQSGTCNLFFYGLGVPTPNTNVPVPNTPTPGGFFFSGQTTAFVLSDIAAGFQGYIMASCNFQYAHGFAWITSAFGQPNGTAMGYLAVALGNRGVGLALESAGH